MVDISPFKGVRPKRQYAEEVSSPPYDVLSTEEARELAKDNPKSFLHVVKPEIDLPHSIGQYEDLVYQKGADNLNRLMEENILVQEDSPSFYIYRLKMGEHTQVGLVACASIDDYFEEKIKKHEHTRKKKEKDRTTHVDTLNANTGPVFQTYKSKEKINALIEESMEDKPLYDFTSEDGIEHTVFKVDDDGLINNISQAFDNIDRLFIADGHHRAKSGAKVGQMRREENPNYSGSEPFNYLLVVIFPHDQMHIMDYNRVVKDLQDYSRDEFLSKVEENFNLEKYSETESFKPQEAHQFGMYLDGTWYKLEAKPGSFDEQDPVEVLDVSILQNNLLDPYLGIEDPRQDERIDFVGGIRGLEELENLVDSGEYRLAFSMYPTKIEQLMRVADADRVMPPKSTWFEPKLRSGLIVHLL